MKLEELKLKYLDQLKHEEAMFARISQEKGKGVRGPDLGYLGIKFGKISVLEQVLKDIDEVLKDR